MDTYKQGFVFTNCKDVKGRTRDCWFDYKNKYECPSPHPFTEGQEVVEGKDYEVRYQVKNFGSYNIFRDATKGLYDIAGTSNRRIIALPTENKSSVAVKRDYRKFFTYPETADFMISLLKDYKDVFKVLEPSAGNGALIKALIKRFPVNAVIDAVEKDNVWFNDLEDMCAKVFIQDFLEFHSSYKYDACVANPPFGNGVDLQAHFDNICELVKEGGQIILIVPEDFTPSISHETIPLENWSKNSDGTSTPIKIIHFSNPVAVERKEEGEEAIAFANFVGNRPLPEYSESTNQWRWWSNEKKEYEFATTEQLYEIFRGY